MCGERVQHTCRPTGCCARPLKSSSHPPAAPSRPPHTRLHVLQLRQHRGQRAPGQQGPHEGLPLHQLRLRDRRQAGAAAGRAAVVAGPARHRVHQPAQRSAIPQHHALAVAAGLVGRCAGVACRREGQRSHRLVGRDRLLQSAGPAHTPHTPSPSTCGAAVRKGLRRVVIVQQAALPAPPRHRHCRQPGVERGPVLQQAAGRPAGVGGKGVWPRRHLVTESPGLGKCLACRRCCWCCCWQVGSGWRHRRLGQAALRLLPGRRRAAAADQKLLLLGRLAGIEGAALQVSSRLPPAPAAPQAAPQQEYCRWEWQTGAGWSH